ncbi:MAG: hypothetical protein ABSE51_14660, partial [Terracidiphilus sp.]
LADGTVSSLHGGSPCKRLATRFFQNRAEPPLNFQLQMGHPLPRQRSAFSSQQQIAPQVIGHSFIVR